MGNIILHTYWCIIMRTMNLCVFISLEKAFYIYIGCRLIFFSCCNTAVAQNGQTSGQQLLRFAFLQGAASIRKEEKGKKRNQCLLVLVNKLENPLFFLKEALKKQISINVNIGSKLWAPVAHCTF